jgi:acyl carrier protein
VTRNAQPVLESDPIDPAHAWVWGFGRAVAAEQPRLRWTSVDVDGGEFTPCDTNETQLAFRDGKAYAARLVRKSIAAPPARRLFRAEATYLVTGAFGALGTRVAKWMVEEGAKQLILTGRNPTPAEIEGARVIAGDIADPAFVERLFASADIKGVIHCFSSAASILGSRGQAAYAGANAFMDALVHQRHRRGLRALAINWGAWGESGMAARLEIRTHHDAMGIVPIDPREGLEILGRLMRGDTVQAGVIRGDWSKLLPARVEAAPRATVPTDRASLESHIRMRIVEVMGRDPFPSAESDLSFFELGMDSLMSLDLRNRLQSDFDRALPSIIAFDYPSIPELAGYLLDTLSTAKDLVHAT